MRAVKHSVFSSRAAQFRPVFRNTCGLRTMAAAGAGARRVLIGVGAALALAAAGAASGQRSAGAAAPHDSCLSGGGDASDMEANALNAGQQQQQQQQEAPAAAW
jgi:hypothetical protein